MAKFKVDWTKKVKIGAKFLAPIVALKTFTTVCGKKVRYGEVGGLVESEFNLSQADACWIEAGAIVAGLTYIGGNTYVGKGIHLYQGEYIINSAIIDPNLEDEDPNGIHESPTTPPPTKKEESDELIEFIEGVIKLLTNLKR